MKLERYEIEPSQDLISITVNQKKNALVNIAISTGIVVLSCFFIFRGSDNSSFFYILAVLGILWLIVSVKAHRTKMSYRFSPEELAYYASNKKDPNVLLPDELSHISLVKLKRKSRKLPFPWEVRIIDNEGKKLKNVFTFQKKENAEELASLLSEYYSLSDKEIKD